MFTGIIEEIGSIANIQRTGESFVLSIEAKRILEDVHLGDSIAVNGICLTVTSFSGKHFTVDVMPETVKATSLHTIKRGTKVYLTKAIGEKLKGDITIKKTDEAKNAKRLKKTNGKNCQGRESKNNFKVENSRKSEKGN